MSSPNSKDSSSTIGRYALRAASIAPAVGLLISFIVLARKEKGGCQHDTGNHSAELPARSLWKNVLFQSDPQVRTIGLIVSQSHTDLVAQVELAAKVSALTIKHEISGSDRETL